MSRLIFFAFLFSFWSSAHAIAIDCEIHTSENHIRTQILDSNHLTRCSFIREGTICEFYIEDNHKFWSYNFDPVILDQQIPGNEFIGVYLEGKVHLDKQEDKTWDVTSEEFMNCMMK